MGGGQSKLRSGEARDFTLQAQQVNSLVSRPVATGQQCGCVQFTCQNTNQIRRFLAPGAQSKELLCLGLVRGKDSGQREEVFPVGGKDVVISERGTARKLFEILIPFLMAGNDNLDIRFYFSDIL